MVKSKSVNRKRLTRQSRYESHQKISAERKRQFGGAILAGRVREEVAACVESEGERKRSWETKGQRMRARLLWLWMEELIWKIATVRDQGESTCRRMGMGDARRFEILGFGDIRV